MNPYLQWPYSALKSERERVEKLYANAGITTSQYRERKRWIEAAIQNAEKGPMKYK